MQKQIKEMVAAEMAVFKKDLIDAARDELMNEEPFKTIVAQGPKSNAELLAAVLPMKEELKEESIAEME